MRDTNPLRRKWTRGLPAAILLAALAAVGAGADAGARVEIAQHEYRLPKLTVPAGTAVTWVNRDDDVHTVTSTAGLFGSGGLDADDTFTFTFAKPGTYDYFCKLHPLMTGTVVVQ